MSPSAASSVTRLLVVLDWVCFLQSSIRISDSRLCFSKTVLQNLSVRFLMIELVFWCLVSMCSFQGACGILSFPSGPWLPVPFGAVLLFRLMDTRLFHQPFEYKTFWYKKWTEFIFLFLFSLSFFRFYPRITGETSLCEQHFRADVGWHTHNFCMPVLFQHGLCLSPLFSSLPFCQLVFLGFTKMLSFSFSGAEQFPSSPPSLSFAVFFFYPAATYSPISSPI